MHTMKRFLTGFICGLLAFVLVNVVSHYANSSPPGRTDRILYFGFPFVVWVEGGLPYSKVELNRSALCGDIAIALSSAAAIGLLFRRNANNEATHSA
jgi:hypothetical protein